MELEKPIPYSRGCDENHWREIVAEGKCYQCGEGYPNNQKPI
jgi:hypothetical protein